MFVADSGVLRFVTGLCPSFVILGTFRSSSPVVIFFVAARVSSFVWLGHFRGGSLRGTDFLFAVRKNKSVSVFGSL